MNIALVGCGFVADYYLATLPLHPELAVRGIFDRRPERAQALAQRYGVPAYASLDALRGDASVQMVLNLTNPDQHFEISRAMLEAGKHVYSEKPLAMEMEQASELIALAAQRGLTIACAPCSLLGETAQTMIRALRNGAVGPVRVVYAEMDDGLVHRMAYRQWTSVSGVPWPYEDEFEVGCTLEHAGYCVSWLAAMFGPARRVVSFASVQVPDKLPGPPRPNQGADFSVACIEFANGVAARLTCSILAPHDHKLTVIGDDGILYTHDSWDYRSPVYRRRWLTIRRRTLLSPLRERIRLPPPPHGRPRTQGAQKMGFARGPAELAASIREGRACRLSPAFSLHVNEIALAIHHARRDGAAREMSTTFELPQPMPWMA